MSQNEATSQDHLAKAREYIAKGDDYYDKAADEIMAARAEGWTIPSIARELGRSTSWVDRLIAAAKTRTARGADEPLSVDHQSGSNKRDDVVAKVLRERPTEVAADIAKAMERPEVRDAVVQHMKPQAAHELHLDARDKSAGNYVPPADRERRQKEADAFSKNQTQPIIDAFTSSNIVLHLEQALEDLQTVENITAETHDKVLILIDQIRTEAEVKRAMEGIR